MMFFFMALATLVASAVVAALLSKRAPTLAAAVGQLGSLVAAVPGLTVAVRVLVYDEPASFFAPWSVPGASFSLAIDALSAWFLVPVFFVSSLAAAAGRSLLSDVEPTRAARTWLWFNLLVAAMAVVVVATNAVLFLVAWEVMSTAAYFLIVTEHERDHVRSAGTMYLVASQIGVAFIVAAFLVAASDAQDLEFSSLAIASTRPELATWVLSCAIVGFGTKAALVPFHAWLPDPYPAAPGHVAAVMSAVVAKVAIYGLFRFVTIVTPTQAWIGWLLIGLGVCSALWGVLMALMQTNLHRSLAYSTVENVGIIVTALGLGWLGVARGYPGVATLAFAGALLHVWNHALFKSLLFLAAGQVVRTTGAESIDELGGLQRRVPVVAGAFLLGSAALCGLPPLNGFVSELFIYQAALEGTLRIPFPDDLAVLVVFPVLALAGALALAAFVRMFGLVFLGVERTPNAGRATDANGGSKAALLIAGLACMTLGIAPGLVFGPLEHALTNLAPNIEATAIEALSASKSWMQGISIGALLLLACIAGLTLVRRLLLRNRSVRHASTWGCGYLAPHARMQYTSTSFSAPLVDLLGHRVLGVTRDIVEPRGLFPRHARLSIHVADPIRERLIEPLVHRVSLILPRLRRMQHGRVRFYLLYIVVTLIVLLAWRFD